MRLHGHWAPAALQNFFRCPASLVCALQPTIYQQLSLVGKGEFLELPRDLTTGIFLQEDAGGHSDSVPPVEPANFLHDDFVGPEMPSAREVEMAFWRVKHHDSGYMMAHTLSLVLDSLPESTRLKIRSSQGHSIECKATDYAIYHHDL